MAIKLSSLPIKNTSQRGGETINELYIVSPFGPRNRRTSQGQFRQENHNGLDIRAATGTPVYAVSAGTVIAAQSTVLIINGKEDHRGVHVILEHTEDDGKTKYKTEYYHLRVNGIVVQQGATVVAGQKIAESGNTGNSDAPHLHFILKNSAGVAIDSVPYLKAVPGSDITGRLTPSTEGVTRRGSRTAAGIISPEGNITPIIGSLESFHPNVQLELTKRRISENTVNTYIPFVKLTSLVNVLKSNLQGGTEVKILDNNNTDTPLDDIAAWCPTLGPHGEDNIVFDNMYFPQSNRSIVGYAWATPQQGTDNIRIPIVVEQKAANRTDPPNIPMPGITEISTERGTAGPMGVRGGLFKANIKITAYSVGQVDTLLKYFLRPATRVVLEIGNQSATQRESTVDAENTFKPFNWNKSADVIAKTFSDIINVPASGSQFIDEYIYGNNGNYEIFVGYVVKFDLKYNKENTYDILLTIHSIQQFEVPTRHTGVKALCPDATNPCRVYDVIQYFSAEAAPLANSFTSLMVEEARIAQRNSSYVWKDDFIAIKAPEPGTSVPALFTETTISTEAAEQEYFVSWKFFIEKILLDERRGILSVVSDQNTKRFLKLGLLRSVNNVLNPQTADTDRRNKLIANQVNYHPDLRSTNADVMIIYNPTAESRKTSEERQDYVDFGNVFNANEDERNRFRKNNVIKDFIESSGVGRFQNRDGDQNEPGIGSLSSGVWLNTKAIKQAFTSQDTITNAIDYLLNMMNAATEGYWNLQLYSTDRQTSGLFVVDMGLSKQLTVMQKPPQTQTDQASSTRPYVDEEELKSGEEKLKGKADIVLNRYQKSKDNPYEPRYLYMFNRGTKRLDDGTFLGSEILDVNVEFNLPQVIAVQAIAGVGGPAQKGTLESIDIPELNRISLIKDIFSRCSKTEVCIDSAKDICGTKIRDYTVIPEGTTVIDDAAQRYLDMGGAPVRAPGESDLSFRVRQQAYSARSSFAPQSTNVRTRRDISTTPEKLNQLQSQFAQDNGMTVSQLSELTTLGNAVEFLVLNRSAFMKKLNRDSTNAEDGRTIPTSHAFNSSNLTKTIASVTLPGIGGVELFQSFLIDRVPSILERGFYVVTKVVHKFAISGGWTTTIEGRFRYAPDREREAKTKGETSPAICRQPAASTGRGQGDGGTGAEGGPWAAYRIPLTPAQLITILKKFQSDNGLPQTGRSDRATIAKLRQFQARYGLKVDGGIGRSGQTSPKMVELLKAGSSLVAVAPTAPTAAQRVSAGEAVDESGEPIQ